MTTTTSTHYSAPSFRPPASVRQQHLASMAIAVGSIWAAVVAVSLWAPDMVSGSEQQHLAVAAFGTWLWGTFATCSVLHFWTRRGRDPDRLQMHRVFSVVVAMVWFAAAAVALFGPVMVTGTDPTRVPLAAIIAPVVATVATVLVRAAVEVAGASLAHPWDRWLPQDAPTDAPT